MGKPLLIPVILLLVNVALGSVGQMFLKFGSSRLNSLQPGQSVAASLLDTVKGMFTPHILVGFLLYGISSIIWIRVLRQVNLSIAYPTISLNFVVVTILSAMIFRERVPLPTVIGLVLICSGVSLIGIGYAQRQ